MTEEGIGKELDTIAAELRMFDLHPLRGDDGTYTLNERTGKAVAALLDLFGRLRWQLKFNSYKELVAADTSPIRERGIFSRKPGTLVKVRSCKPEHGEKTYLGILIGDVAHGISHSVKDGVVTASHSGYNPGIIIPELGEIVYGCESWWGEIESEEDLDKLITAKTIQDVWYVRLLKALSPSVDGSETDKEVEVDEHM